MDVSTRQLRAFVALAQQRNFTRAAARLHLSQPAFSALIRSLEELLGVRLFDRNTRKVELTPEGESFEEVAQRLLADFDHAMTDVRDHVARRRGRVSLAVLPSLAAGWLPPVLSEFHALYPGIDLDVADVLSEDCLERVRSGSADFALAAIRADSPELRTEVFCSDRFHLVCRADHPLATAPVLRLRDLASHPFVQLARTSSVRQYLDAAVHPMQMNTLMEVEQLATVMGMVRSGLGISVVPALTLFHFEQPGLVTRPLQVAGLTRRIFLIRRRDRSLSAAAQALYELVMRKKPDEQAG
ncbi:LysR family transcriptional regulator [Caldimonas tepidiphila]|uniref:LysR family transcriptional regulator n=1 Tax=Caldimonas tepidiphila TaxID=2315841 RepID=UPI000E5AD865|nr:LysR family transcriptional regulator [Caldimonas tepidiphila]